MAFRIIQHAALGNATKNVIRETDRFEKLTVDTFLNFLQLTGRIVNNSGLRRVLPKRVISTSSFERSIISIGSASELNQLCDVDL